MPVPLTNATIVGNRRYVPFDTFAMRVDVPVSSMVRDGDLGWTCGQCPLDRQGDVMSPFDLISQTGFVCDMIETTVQRAGFTKASIGKLNAYFSETAAGQSAQALAAIKARFDHQPVIVPIQVPHFYYDGMMLEIDVFAGPRSTPRTLITSHGTSLQIADAGEVIWASVTADVMRHASLFDCLSEITSTLDGQGLAAAHRLSDHWFLSSQEGNCASDVESLYRCSAIANPDTVICIDSDRSTWLVGELTFSRDRVRRTHDKSPDDKLRLCRRSSRTATWISGVSADPLRDLVGQTEAIMASLDQSLTAEGLSFADVVKLTAHYVGGASAEELHGNMKVRHSYYASPGPASTGLPVDAFLNPDCKVAIDIIAKAARD